METTILKFPFKINAFYFCMYALRYIGAVPPIISINTAIITAVAANTIVSGTAAVRCMHRQSYTFLPIVNWYAFVINIR